MTQSATEILTQEELAEVRTRSDFKGVLCVVHAYAVIFGAMAALALIPNPLVWAIGIVLIGARQLGLAILMHDAAHGILTNDKRLNDILGQYFCAWPVFTDLFAYRPYHLTHHRWTQQPNDPDIGLSAPFPITRSSLVRKIVRDLSGQTTLKQRTAQFRSALGKPDMSFADRAKNFRKRLAGPIAVNVAFFVVLAALGYWWLYFALWVVPFFTWFPMITRIRNIAEHAVVPDNDDPFRNARTTLASPFMRAVLAPYWVNYHVEHHLFMYVPCYNLPRLHQIMVAKGYAPRMEIQPNYWVMLDKATAKRPGTPPANDDPNADTTNNHGAGLAFNISSRDTKSA